MPWYMPLIVYFCRIGDVSVGTIRIISVMRGHKMLSAVLGFLEVIIWIFAVSTVITHLQDNFIIAFAYAAGFATGNLVGMTIEERLAMGNVMLRVVNTNRNVHLSAELRKRNFVVTEVEGIGFNGPTEISLILLRRKDSQEVVNLIKEITPDVFISVEDVRHTTATLPRLTATQSNIPNWLRRAKMR